MLLHFREALADMTSVVFLCIQLNCYYKAFCPRRGGAHLYCNNSIVHLRESGMTKSEGPNDIVGGRMTRSNLLVTHWITIDQLS